MCLQPSLLNAAVHHILFFMSNLSDEEGWPSSMSILMLSQAYPSSMKQISAILSKLDLDDPVRQMPVKVLRRLVEGHVRALPYETAMPVFEEEMKSYATGNSMHEQLMKFVLMAAREKAMRVAIGPLEMKLQLRQGELQGLHWKEFKEFSHLP